MAGPEDIERFWDWFATAEERLDEALREPDGRGTAIDEIRFRVGKVGLACDVLQAADGRHLIVGSAASDPDRRLLAAHWVVGAPPSDRFAFSTHHPAEPIDRLMGSTLSGKPAIAIAQLRFTRRWRQIDDRADIGIYIPPGITGHHGDRIATTVLHSALGELEADSWLGRVTLLPQAPADGLDLARLLTTLAPEIQARSQPHWEEYRYEKPGAPPLTVLLRGPLQPARHPFLDTCIEISTQLINDEPDEPGRMRDQLMDDMPGDILLTGAVISAGRQTTLIYANGRSPTVNLLRDRAAMLGSDIHAAHDPDWRRVRRFQAIDPNAV